jgi:hypothetical protein
VCQKLIAPIGVEALKLCLHRAPLRVLLGRVEDRLAAAPGDCGPQVAIEGAEAARLVGVRHVPCSHARSKSPR